MSSSKLTLIISSLSLHILQLGNGGLLRWNSFSRLLFNIKFVLSEMFDFKNPLLFGLIIEQVMTLLKTMRENKTYILISSIIFKCLNKLNDSHIIRLLDLIEDYSGWSVEFLANSWVWTMSGLIIDFNSSMFNSNDICEVDVCQIDHLTKEFNGAKLIGDLKGSQTLEFQV